MVLCGAVLCEREREEERVVAWVVVVDMGRRHESVSCSQTIKKQRIIAFGGDVVVC